LGDNGDSISRDILANAAESLAELAGSVIERLDMKDRAVPIAKAGGTIGRSKYFDAAIDAGLARVAPRAHIVTLQEKPAEAAAKLAIRLGLRKAHAG
jgi:N-acetylglucosamine kinase-like BadF-type ATPase